MRLMWKMSGIDGWGGMSGEIRWDKQRGADLTYEVEKSTLIPQSSLVA